MWFQRKNKSHKPQNNSLTQNSVASGVLTRQGLSPKPTGVGDKNPLMITVCGIGAELTQKDTPYLPANPQEIINEAILISKMGAQIFHLHIRDENGKSTLDPTIVGEVISEIKNKTDLILQISTGGDVEDSFESRLATLNHPISMASLTLGSINFGNDVFLNPLPLIEELAKTMKQKHIKPELEIFDTSMMDTFYLLVKKELLAPPYHFNIILGGPGWTAATKQNLEFILSKLPKNSSWSGSGIGRFQDTMIDLALEKGAHVRTGLEDNIYLEKGVLAKGNTELVQKVLEKAKKLKRKLATVDETKKILGIP